MARAFWFYTMELREGVTEEEFELFLKDEWREYTHRPGETGGWLKDRDAEGRGKYIAYLEAEDLVARRKRYFTADLEPNEVAKQHDEANPHNSRLLAKFLELCERFDMESPTRYVDIDIDYLS